MAKPADTIREALKESGRDTDEALAALTELEADRDRLADTLRAIVNYGLDSMERGGPDGEGGIKRIARAALDRHTRR